MRAVIQRVREAKVRVDDETVGEIGRGLLVLVSAGQGDTSQDADWLLHKITHQRIFPDADDKMNLSVQDIGGSLLLVSQFTLHGDCRKGHRPSFGAAMAPADAEVFFADFVEKARFTGVPIETGRFGANMQVELINDGPVTTLLDSKKAF